MSKTGSLLCLGIFLIQSCVLTKTQTGPAEPRNFPAYTFAYPADTRVRNANRDEVYECINSDSTLQAIVYSNDYSSTPYPSNSTINIAHRNPSGITNCYISLEDHFATVDTVEIQAILCSVASGTVVLSKIKQASVRLTDQQIQVLLNYYMGFGIEPEESSSCMHCGTIISRFSRGHN